MIIHLRIFQKYFLLLRTNLNYQLISISGAISILKILKVLRKNPNDDNFKMSFDMKIQYAMPYLVYSSLLLDIHKLKSLN